MQKITQKITQEENEKTNNSQRGLRSEEDSCSWKDEPETGDRAGANEYRVFQNYPLEVSLIHGILYYFYLFFMLALLSV